MSPEETHEALRETMESTIAFLGGPTGWSQYVDNPPEQCTLPDGTDGVTFTARQTGPGVTDAEATVTGLETHWESLGLSPERVDSARTQIVLFGYGGPVKSMGAFVDAELITVSGEAHCVPGDFAQLLDEHLDAN
ncbi:hypothetical protein [Agromyces cerinus]|uniref:Uncharacterized protein n=1 Tax=Agromyces cerinus subsp. cerinus TaxID=232089 RepID=A0A1N6E4M4_9MICO|nr:hypothetical protein [Agromyces cerinus]SIN78005.1 hypothetical protein SAMN05443544_1083 [Agromyces cerinus subsp. cerinus]